LLRELVTSKLRWSGNSYSVGLSSEQDLANRCSGRERSAKASAYAAPFEKRIATGEAVDDSGFRLIGPESWARLKDRPLRGLGSGCFGGTWGKSGNECVSFRRSRGGG
jgi:hypothetical protein